MKLTIGEMFEEMELDLDEANLAYFGGPTKAIQWLRRAYSNLYGVVVKYDLDGTLLGQEVAATYTAGSENMPLSTWSPLGPPSRILRVGLRAAGVSSGAGEECVEVPRRAVDFDEANLAHSAPTYTIFGGRLYLRQIPTADRSVVLTFVAPAVKLYCDAMAGAPAPPEGASWDDYSPPFVEDHYSAIPALAVVMAERAENKPSADHAEIAMALEQDLITYVSGRQNIHSQLSARVSDPWRYRM